jgi:capsular polysaccharide biosynthesis protein
LKSFNYPRAVLLPSNGYYHWLIEDLPLFLETLKHIPNPRILIYNRSPQFVKDFALSLNQQVSYISRFVNLNTISVINKGPNTEWTHPLDVEILREHFAKNLLPRRDGLKIYVSREKSSRSPIFERELAQLLKKSGWQIIFAEEMSLIEQIRTFSEAEVVCGVHGAGLSGMIWMKEGGKIIELSPEKFIPCFARMSIVSKHKYVRIEIQNIDLHKVANLVIEIEAFL